jgi:methylaspartate mutase epsilon subunit
VELRNGKIDVDDLLKMRPDVLAAWRTGAGAEDIEASFARQRDIPVTKRLSSELARAEDEGATPLVQPRAGVCLVADHKRLLGRLETEGGADLLPTTIDSYTRQNRYAEAETGIEESMRSGHSALNGFPAVNWGVGVCREVVDSVGRPVQVRHGTPDARLLCEIALAGGFTGFEGGGISYNIPYAKNVSLEQSLAWWQYVDRLVGLYAEEGAVVNREPFGPLTGTLVPPCITNAVAIVEAVLAAVQGVRDITVGCGQGGNLYQDVAAVRVLARQCREYLDRFGCGDVALSTVFHQWMGGFPVDEAMAFGVISWGAVAAAFSGATKVITKSPQEALGIPSADANIAGLKATRQVLNLLKGQPRPTAPEIEREEELIERETSAIIEVALGLGEGDLARGVVRAFEAGVLDVPFAPSRMAAGAVLPARDLTGAIRILEFGNLPLDDDTKAFHRDALAERAKAQGREVSFQMVTDDIYAVSKGRLVGTSARSGQGGKSVRSGR